MRRHRELYLAHGRHRGSSNCDGSRVFDVDLIVFRWTARRALAEDYP